MTFPNFLIVGAAKSGTTSIYHYLKEHPEIFFTQIKEPCYLSYSGYDLPYELHPHAVVDTDKYLSLFDESSDRKMRGEATAIYLHLYENVIQNIQKKFSNPQRTKIIIILRNPVDRAFSQYMMHVRDLKEDLNFEEALNQEQQRIKEGKNVDFWYKDRGFYTKQVKAYMDNFDDVLVLWYDDLRKEPKNIVDKICRFLGVKSLQTLDTDKTFNASGVPKNKGLIKFIQNYIDGENSLKSIFKAFVPKVLRKRMGQSIKRNVYNNTLEKVKMDEKTRKRLIDLYKEDIKALERLTGQNLDHWLK